MRLFLALLRVADRLACGRSPDCARAGALVAGRVDLALGVGPLSRVRLTPLVLRERSLFARELLREKFRWVEGWRSSRWTDLRRSSSRVDCLRSS